MNSEDAGFHNLYGKRIEPAFAGLTGQLSEIVSASWLQVHKNGCGTELAHPNQEKLCHSDVSISAVSILSGLFCPSCQPVLFLSSEKPLSDWFL